MRLSLSGHQASRRFNNLPLESMLAIAILSVTFWTAAVGSGANEVLAEEPSARPSPDDQTLVRRIASKIQSVAGVEQRFDDYQSQIPNTGVDYAMVAIPGGIFKMGSPDDEVHRDFDEGPTTLVRVDDFWMGKFEVTWDQYEPFMINQVARRKDGMREDYDPTVHGIVDGISAPTAPYTEMSFGMGQQGYPAICMTHHAANKFCQWISAQTGHFYRLPTEAEWEYATRGGTQTPYSCSVDHIEDYAWFYDNANDQYQPVGQKLANPRGLFDMHGNVKEWTADQYYDDYFDRLEPFRGADGVVTNPWLRPTTLYPRSVRGGCWDDDPDQLRSANRGGSDKEWKMQDPQLPRSIWYHTDATGVGFRLVRPRTVPDADVMHAHWNSGTGLGG